MRIKYIYLLYICYFIYMQKNIYPPPPPLHCWHRHIHKKRVWAHEFQIQIRIYMYPMLFHHTYFTHIQIVWNIYTHGKKLHELKSSIPSVATCRTATSHIQKSFRLIRSWRYWQLTTFFFFLYIHTATARAHAYAYIYRKYITALAYLQHLSKCHLFMSGACLPSIQYLLHIHRKLCSCICVCSLSLSHSLSDI